MNRRERRAAGKRQAAPPVDPLFAQAVRHHQAGRLAEADALYRQVVAANPRHAAAWDLWGGIACQAGRPDVAAEMIGRAVALDGKVALYHYNLGNALARLGRLDDAASSFERAVALAPDHAAAHINLGGVLLRLGRFEAAVPRLRRAVVLAPERSEPHANLGLALLKQGQAEAAVACLRQAAALAPDNPEAHANLAAALQGLDRLDEAADSFRRALDLRPEAAGLRNDLGAVLSALGRLDEAVACFRRAVADDPEGRQGSSNLMVTLPFIGDADAVYAEARRFGARFAGIEPLARIVDPDPERPLRIGYLTPSLRTHALVPYLEPVFRAQRRLANSVHVYANVPDPDEVTWRLKDLVDSWTFVHDQSDDDVAARIAADGIDILIDPMGHWSGNRLPVFARRPAPVQVSYLCQGLTTGLAAIDYAIGDAWLNQGGAMRRHCVEQVVELPGGFQVTAFDDATVIGTPPIEANGFVTFGSFNNPEKLSDPCLDLWAAVLAAVPTSRLLIKGPGIERPALRSLLLERLARRGVAAERIETVGWIAGGGFLEVYNRVDIVLDTVPFSGGRTTVDALWMGVPVVTAIGDSVYGRYSYSHLARIGAPELAARDAAEYVALAAELAGDPGRLRRYREGLRPALDGSSLFDADRHVAELDAAFRVMWRRRVAGLPPRGFSL